MEYFGEWNDWKQTGSAKLNGGRVGQSGSNREAHILTQTSFFIGHMIRLEVDPTEIHHILQLLSFASNPGDTPKETYSQVIGEFIQALEAKPPKEIKTSFYNPVDPHKPNWDAIMKRAYGDDYKSCQDTSNSV